MRPNLVAPMLVAMTAVAFVVSTTGFGTCAKMAIAGNTFEVALADHLKYATIFTTAWLAAPFIVLTVISFLFARKRGARFGLVICTLGILGLGWLYFLGYFGAERSMLQHKWTAAALSIGLLPFISIIPLALVGAIGVAAMWIKGRRS